MRMKKIILIIGVFLLVLMFFFIRRFKTFSLWSGEPLICREVVAIVWVKPEISEKKSYKKFTDANEIKEILKQVATPARGKYTLEGKEKHELRIYFLNGDSYRVYFALEGDEFIGPNGRNKELFKILNSKEESPSFWGDLTPEEIEEQCKLMKEVIKEKKKLRKVGL